MGEKLYKKEKETVPTGNPLAKGFSKGTISPTTRNGLLKTYLPHSTVDKR